MKRKFGAALMILGLLLLLGAGWLYLANQEEGERAQKSVEKFLPQVMQSIRQKIEPRNTEPFDASSEASEVPIDPDFYSTEMTVEVIDGYAFVGYLSVPSLELQLPIIAETSDELLKISPCRFFGSTKTDNLVIGGHNYWQHFGQLPNLNNGDTVIFTDMDGLRTSYELITMEVLDPNNVDDLTKGEYPLSLFTCTYGGSSRITLRFDIIQN